MILPLVLLACTGSAPDPAASSLPGDDAVPAVPPVGFSLAFSGNLDGELEPCG